MEFFRKIVFELINLACNNRIGFFIFKEMKIFDAVFVMYPANQEFSNYFTFVLRQFLIARKPYIVGWITHPSGKRTLQFAVSTFFDKGEQDPETLREFYAKVEGIKKAVGAQTLHFAGTLPGRFTRLRVNRGSDQKNEREVTASCVVKAVLNLRERLGHDATNQVVILGSRGYVGKQVVNQLSQQEIDLVGVDLDTISDGFVPPVRPYIIVNITVPEAINEYIEMMDENTVLLNEVYPSPHRDVLIQLQGQGVQVYHIAGVEAKAFPLFPQSYQGAVPCCAALNDETYSVRIIRIA